MHHTTNISATQQRLQHKRHRLTVYKAGRKRTQQSHFSAHATLCTKVVFTLALCLSVLRGQLGAVSYSVTQPAAVDAALLPTGSSQLLHVLIWVLQSSEHRRDALLRFLQEVLQIQQDRFALVLVDEGCGNACLATSACTPNPAHHHTRLKVCACCLLDTITCAGLTLS